MAANCTALPRSDERLWKTTRSANRRTQYHGLHAKYARFAEPTDKLCTIGEAIRWAVEQRPDASELGYAVHQVWVIRPLQGRYQYRFVQGHRGLESSHA